MDRQVYYYKDCSHCGHKTGKSRSPESGAKRCWQCGRRINIDINKSYGNKKDESTHRINLIDEVSERGDSELVFKHKEQSNED